MSPEVSRLGPRQVSARLEGEEVANGTILVDRLVTVLSNLQLAVRHIAEDIAGQRRTRGRIPRGIAEQTAFRLVSVMEGSWGAVLELERPVQLPMFEIGEEALAVLLEEMHQVEGGDVARLSGPAEAEIRNLLRVVGDGVSALTLSGGPKQGRVRFDAGIVGQLLAVKEVPVVRRAVVSGRLREVDYKDRTAELYDASGKMTRVVFSPEQEGVFEIAANRMVAIDGQSEEAVRGPGRIKVDGLHILELKGDFWERRSARQLAEEFHIPAFSRQAVDEADFWPSDVDPDEFVRGIYDDRERGSGETDDGR